MPPLEALDENNPTFEISSQQTDLMRYLFSLYQFYINHTSTSELGCTVTHLSHINGGAEKQN